MKTYIEILALENGAHRNQTGSLSAIPEGWAVIPDELETENFPYGEVEVEDVVHYKEVMKSREVEVVNEDGETVIETEWYTEQEPEYSIMTVVKWTPLPMPEPEPLPEPEPTELEQLRADVDYLLMMEEG